MKSQRMVKRREDLSEQRAPSTLLDHFYQKMNSLMSSTMVTFSRGGESETHIWCNVVWTDPKETVSG